MQGFLIVTVGIALMYLLVSGKLDCVIASFRACSGSSASTPGAIASPTSAPGAVNPKQILGNVLSPEIS